MLYEESNTKRKDDIMKEDNAYVKETTPVESWKGKVVTIPAKATLRDEKDVTHSFKTTRNHNVTVIGQIDHKNNRDTLLEFSATWLQGVKSAYIRVRDIKKV